MSFHFLSDYYAAGYFQGPYFRLGVPVPWPTRGQRALGGGVGLRLRPINTREFSHEMIQAVTSTLERIKNGGGGGSKDSPVKNGKDLSKDIPRIKDDIYNLWDNVRKSNERSRRNQEEVDERIKRLRKRIERYRAEARRRMEATAREMLERWKRINEQSELEYRRRLEDAVRELESVKIPDIGDIRLPERRVSSGISAGRMLTGIAIGAVTYFIIPDRYKAIKAIGYSIASALILKSIS